MELFVTTAKDGSQEIGLMLTDVDCENHKRSAVVIERAGRVVEFPSGVLARADCLCGGARAWIWFACLRVCVVLCGVVLCGAVRCVVVLRCGVCVWCVWVGGWVGGWVWVFVCLCGVLLCGGVVGCCCVV